MSEEFLDILEDSVFAKARAELDLPTPIVGLCSLDLHFCPSPEARSFSYNVVIAQSSGQGACYYLGSPLPTATARSLLGQPFPASPIHHRGARIALLDSLANSLHREPAKMVSLRGTSSQKAHQRAALVADEVTTLVSATSGPKKIVMVGYVQLIAGALAANDCNVVAVDYESEILNSTPSTTMEISKWDSFESQMAEADAVLATGMTLATGTLAAILQSCENHDVPLAIYAQTGASLAPFYIARGVSLVVAEPFPFYTFAGVSDIEVFRL